MSTILDPVTRAMLEAVPYGVIVLESSEGAASGGRVAFANRAAVAQLGRELAGQPLAEIEPGAAPAVPGAAPAPPGATLAPPVAAPAPPVVAAAARAQRFLDSIIENLPAMIFVKRAEDLRFVRFNRAGEELLGRRRAELLGRNDFDFFPAAQAAAFVEKDRQVLAQGHALDIPAEPIQTRRGVRWLHTRKIPIFEGGAARYLLGVSIDITEIRRAEEALRTSHDELERRVAERTAALEREIDERRRAEQELRRVQERLLQAQKLEAIGQLAGGMAHDFNNLLTVVLSYATLLIPTLDAGDRRRAHLEEVKRAGERGAALIRQLLAFSRQQVIEQRVLDLGAIVGELAPMIRRLVGEDVEVTTRIQPGLGHVKADAGSLEQVIINLVVNARDAMPGGGALTIELEDVELDEVHGRDHPGGRAGPHVLLAVSDTGVGMDRETQQRIFEPFFTTKPAGEGTGLGLATVFGIVAQAGGNIWVYSEPGAGTTFKVYLPRTEEEAQLPAPRTAAPAAPTAAAAPARRSTETILVAEDEAPLRTVMQRVLEDEGFTVLCAASGPEAIELCERHPGEIQLLLTDVVMPRMSGRELAARIAPLRPAMKILFMSGYTERAIASQSAAAPERGQPEPGARPERIELLPKPITPESLLRRVRELLDSP